MLLRKTIWPAIMLLGVAFYSHAQRTYKSSSILSTGNWYKISVSEPGIYKIDLSFLSALGINTANMPSSAIQLFGNGGQMLPE
jgi:hypothetical protein